MTTAMFAGTRRCPKAGVREEEEAVVAALVVRLGKRKTRARSPNYCEASSSESDSVSEDAVVGREGAAWCATHPRSPNIQKGDARGPFGETQPMHTSSRSQAAALKET